ncbi:MAG: translation initiation factor 2, partial [Eubacterium sp.]|nr:translation initiation factor 2 [Eubacterium sp.]
SIILPSIENSIVFIDEDNDFLRTEEFAEAIRNSSNYYVIVTREGLPNLPYSVNEIYGIRESGKYVLKS